MGLVWSLSPRTHGLLWGGGSDFSGRDLNWERNLLAEGRPRV